MANTGAPVHGDNRPSLALPERPIAPALAGISPAPTNQARPEAESSLRQPFIDLSQGAILGPSALETNARPATTPALDPALLQSGASLQNSNLVTALHPDPSQSVREQGETLLRLARRQRLERGYDLASENLARLIQSHAPDDLRRAALLEMAVLAVEERQFDKAQKAYSQFLRQYPDDECLPEICLRQGLIYRQMGAPAMAEAKFYAVITCALSFKKGHLDYYRRLVLQAQTEIADTAYAEGKHAEAADFYTRLLRQDAPELHRPRIHYRIIQSLAALQRHSQTVSQADAFLTHHPRAAEEPEVRFLLASALKQLGRNQEALTQVLRLLQSQQAKAPARPAQWAHWQQRAGNAIANQMYQEGDFLNALAIYEALTGLNPDPGWQLPVQYQVGLIQERLQQPAAAGDTYRAIVNRAAKLGADTTPALRTVIDMARWRMEFLQWQAKADSFSQTNALLTPSPEPPTAPSTATQPPSAPLPTPATTPSSAAP
jgi:tetratricopeptide (TPR) repeat protein